MLPSCPMPLRELALAGQDREATREADCGTSRAICNRDPSTELASPVMTSS